jgi:hypothetical protein
VEFLDRGFRIGQSAARGAQKIDCAVKGAAHVEIGAQGTSNRDFYGFVPRRFLWEALCEGSGHLARTNEGAKYTPKTTPWKAPRKCSAKPTTLDLENQRVKRPPCVSIGEETGRGWESVRYVWSAVSFTTWPSTGCA